MASSRLRLFLAACVSAAAPPAQSAIVSTVSPLPGPPPFTVPGRYEFTVIDVIRGALVDPQDVSRPGPTIADDGTVLWNDFDFENFVSRLQVSDGVTTRTVVEDQPGALRLLNGSHTVSDTGGFVVFEAVAPRDRADVFVAAPDGLPVRVTGPDIPATLIVDGPQQLPDDAPPQPSQSNRVSCVGACAISNAGRAGFAVLEAQDPGKVAALGTASRDQSTIFQPEGSIKRAPVTLLGGTLPVYVAQRVFETVPGNGQAVDTIFFDQLNAQFAPFLGAGIAEIDAYALDGTTAAVAIRPLEGDTRPLLFKQEAQGQPELIADARGPLDGFASPSLNGVGAVVFEGFYDVSPEFFPAVFDGGDPLSDRVLGPGSRLFPGTMVERVALRGGDALNEAGQIALSAVVRELNGDLAIYVLRADPRPAPGFLTVNVAAEFNGFLGASSLSQSFLAPAGTFDLGFDLDWIGGDALLEVVLDGETLDFFDPTESGRWTLSGLPGGSAERSTLSFLFSGEGALRLDNIVARGLLNGDFEMDGLAEWTAEGAVYAQATALAPVPLPGGLALLAPGLAALLLVGGRSSSHHPQGFRAARRILDENRHAHAR